MTRSRAISLTLLVCLVLLIVAIACGPPAAAPSAFRAETGSAVESTLASSSQATPTSAWPPVATIAPITVTRIAPVTQGAERSSAADVGRVTVTPSPTPIHKLSILYLRQQQYPGSDLKIEQKLSSGSNYERYIASYYSEGLKQYGLLTVPRGQQPATGWPVIIFNHGYIPPEQYRTTQRYVAYVDGFAKAGYIVFRPDYRGHDQSEGEAVGPYGSPAYTIDVLNAVASIKRYPVVDPARIGMWGHSMGGWITLRAMVVSQDIKAGVIWGGVVGAFEDLLDSWRPGPSAGGDTLPVGDTDDPSFLTVHPPPGSNVALWASLSANYFLDDLSGPVQLHHATGDRTVPVEFSQLLYRQAQAAGMPVELRTYKGDNHNISAHFATAMAESVASFDRWLKTPVDITTTRDAMVYAGGSTVNLRGGPGPNYKIMGKLQPGQSLPVTGKNAEGTWWRVKAADGNAWVAASVVLAAHTARVPVVEGEKTPEN
jgi:uncharacterized protein